MPASATILFGPMDRHNLGDLLFARIVERLLDGMSVIHAGLAARDLRASGGQLTRSVVEVADALGNTPVNLIHVGGETLGCLNWEAAALLDADPACYTRYATPDPATQRAWASQGLGIDQPLPYVLPRSLFRNTRQLIHNAIGGVGLAQQTAATRETACGNLREADYVGVRDTATREALASCGVAAHLLPDCGVMVREVLGEDIDRHAQAGAVAAIRARFPDGYLAIQFSSDFADDPTLTELAAQLREVAQRLQLALVLFRAGAAPLHDDLALYRRLMARLGDVALACFESPHIYDICALIAGSRGFAGSSLHGRIVALAYGLPRVSLLPPALCGRPNKLQAFVDTWQDPYPAVACEHLAQRLLEAMASEPDSATAQRLCHNYHLGFAEWRALLADT